MPELPEVETTRRGIAPWLEGRRIAEIRVHNPRLRWPVDTALAQKVPGALVEAVDRRAKYLLLRTDRGTGLLHLGMSGSLRVLPPGDARIGRPGTHDCVDILARDGTVVRFHDPRRFGSLHWTEADPATHPLLADLGPEPLGPGFTGGYLAQRSRGRKVAIKSHIMNARIVVGVGNIYASEALFRAGVHPGRAAGRIATSRFDTLAEAIRAVLSEAIRAGGTTLRDFHGGDGQPGYFTRQLRVYDRAGLPCLDCGTPIRQVVTGQRSTYYCPRCQR
jgi:formamidopyrimidine-DNA glycosylase